MPVSDSLNLIFVHIPKNAGTTIDNTFFGEERGKFSGHHKWGTYKTKVSDKWDNYTTFSIVRNPWDRVVSSYVYARKDESYWHSAINPEQSRMGKHFDYDTLKDKSFSEAVEMIDDLEHQSWGSQYPYICDDEKNTKVDYVLRMENLNSELENMFSEEGVEVKYNMKKENVTREEKDYREWYNGETKKKVKNYYKTDIELFDYSF